MDIEKCCSKTRLPGGERKWRRMAKLAGFNGTVRVVGFNKKRDSIPHNMILLGTYRPETKTITVRIKGHSKNDPTFNRGSYSPIATFGHELGHTILERRGKDMTTGKDFHGNREQANDPIERACDRYSRLLRRNT